GPGTSTSSPAGRRLGGAVRRAIRLRSPPGRRSRRPGSNFFGDSGRTPIACGGHTADKSITIVTDPPQHGITPQLIPPIHHSCGAYPLREALDERRRQDHLQGPHPLINRVTSLRERGSVTPEP